MAYEINSDEYFMRRAFDLAIKGRNKVQSNPNVGAVIVYQNHIIGEGYHEIFGSAHAEVNAFKSIKKQDEQFIENSTIYVSLEPCCIHGKTPPCADLIIKKKVKRVVCSILDPNPKVAGNGLKRIEDHGILTTKDVLPNEGFRIIAPFIKNLEKKPFVSLKWASSSNFIMGSRTKRMLFSGSMANLFTHTLRAEHDGILIGKNTALLDNPSLTTRVIQGQDPIRIILDSKCELPNNLKLFNDSIPTLIVNQKEFNYSFETPNHITLLNLSNPHDWNETGRVLFDCGINRLLVEGGKSVHQYFIKQKIWDQAYIIKNSNQVQDIDANVVRAPQLSGRLAHKYHCGCDEIYRVLPS